MAHHDLLVALHHFQGLPENDCVNTLHFEINGPDTVEGVCDEVAGAYVAQAGIFSGAISSMTIKAYEEGLNPAGPGFSKDYPFVGAGSASVAEVALCLSYAAVDDPEGSSPRRRGRIFLGPLSGAQLSNERPPAAFQDSALAFGQALASAGTAGNTTWLMYSQRDLTYAKIESIWVDDAWDIQRRRGLAPTARRVADVQ